MTINQSSDGSLIQCMISREELKDNDINLDEIKNNNELRDNLVRLVLNTVAQRINIDFSKVMSPIGLIVSGDNTLIVELRINTDSVNAMSISDFLKQLYSSIVSSNEAQKNDNKHKSMKRKASVNLDVHTALLKLNSLEHGILFSKAIHGLLINNSILYKYKGQYYLFLELNCSDNNILEGLYETMLEYSVSGGTMCSAEFLAEHADIIIDSTATEVLSNYF